MCFLLALFLAVAASALAKDKGNLFHVKVLSSGSHQIQAALPDPPNCNWKDISAYCYDSSPETYIENMMIVQEDDGTVLHVACTEYYEWSHCVNLPVDQSYEARMTKEGLEIRYLDEHHHMRTQVYQVE